VAEVQLEIGGRTYPVSCRDGEEPHLLKIAQLVDAKANEAKAAVGTGGEMRQLLLASLLLADELQEARNSGGAASPPPMPAQTDHSGAFEALAGQLEALASKLENRAQSA
jgi:cell division protein ZapA